jgi:glutamate N-acetyltransferase/amino-acid N-acetyltransferase
MKDKLIKNESFKYYLINDGTITTTPGVLVSSSHCGIRKWKEDICLVFIPGETVCSGVFTKNKFAAAPVKISKEQLKKNRNINAICINSGIANACTGTEGISNAYKTIDLVSGYLKIPVENILIASTGRIGKQLPMDRLERGIEFCTANLKPDAGHNAARAILTIDKHPKEVAIRFKINGREIIIGGIAKGSVMLEPDMATTLSFLTTNAVISDEIQDELLFECVDKTFNCISTDGCQSTNDMVLIVANGKSGVKIKKDKRSFEIFRNALMLVLKELCMKIVEDAEGATKVISIKVSGAGDKKEARVLGKKVANSILFKSAMYGEDINWGRIAAAIGSIDNYIDSNKVDISLGNVMVMQNGTAKEFDKEAANRLMHEKNIEFKINLNSGKHDAEILTNDITYEYIKINAFYKKQK